ncbi:DUF6059 family protein [Streptomyces sp. TLI_171]|uniref:DUF6059 family protein n=1 Tax=Streptomyces sp. TLI_171 TaxID=1938859 RepID=UPI000C51D065|nr:DUF6059 family protein [Streptomyces sp. TLI_171]RKE21257.1 hypothetical protein BX266_4636 [Streptomyces sp. TLI_171]
MSGSTRSTWPLLRTVGRRLVWALALLGGMQVYGGVQLYLELYREEVLLHGDGAAPWPLIPPITLVPPGPGHPEQLIPEVPLSDLELELRAQLAHLDRLVPGGNRRGTRR